MNYFGVDVKNVNAKWLRDNRVKVQEVAEPKLTVKTEAVKITPIMPNEIENILNQPIKQTQTTV